MPLTNQQRHRLDSATLLTLNGGCGPFIVASLVLGSGILPISFTVLLVTGLLVGVMAAIPAVAFGRTPRRFKALAAAGIVATIIGSAAGFMHFQSTGLEHAKRYGERWAAAVNSTRQQRGEWPRSIHEALSPGQPAAPRLPWPYLASCHDDFCKVAGYFVTYRIDERSPHLTVGRRDITLEWDWTSSAWR